MIKAIIFDCFGVLATDGWLPFKRKHFANDPDKMEHATSLNHQVDAGLISEADFVGEIAQMAQVSTGEVNKALTGVLPNEQLLQYIHTELQPAYKIGMLSNVSGDWLHRMFTDEEIELFDALALSYEIGYTKPDQRAYETIAERLGVTTDECVFIDDQAGYVAAAEALGMQGIVYRSYDELLESLEPLVRKG